MKKRTFAILLIILATPLYLKAQKKVAIPEVTEEVAKAMDVYDFDTAEELLESRIAALTKKKLSTEKEEAKLEEIGKLQHKLQATEKVTFIDSIIVDKTDFLRQMSLGNECGSVEFVSMADGAPVMDCTLYYNELGNRKILSQQAKGKGLRLFESNLLGTEWSAPVMLKGLDDEDTAQNYPFMLNDGATLYYAAINEEEGLGNYDIYMTRYDADDKVFLQPENVGMPFNSPANDYMLVIDEFNNLGHFATDRNQPEGKVCIYTFIPNETRHIYSDDNMEDDEIAAYARIASIKDTWKNKDEVKQAQERLKALRLNKQNENRQHDFDFIINDRTTYTTLSDFKTEEGKKCAAWWLETRKDLSLLEAELQKLRDKYAASAQAERNQIAPQIRIMENKAQQMYDSIKQNEKNMRKAENKE